MVLKSITKLPKEYEPFIYPTLVAVVWENPEAENILRKDFDIEVIGRHIIILLSLFLILILFLFCNSC